MKEKKWYNQSDVVMGVGVIAIVAMLIIPLPGFILDLLIVVVDARDGDFSFF